MGDGLDAHHRGAVADPHLVRGELADRPLTDHQRRSEAAKAAAAERRSRERFYIQFNLKGAPVWQWHNRFGYGRWIWPRAVWPILFTTREEAEAAVETLPIFANADAIPGRARIRSASIEKILLPKAA